MKFTTLLFVIILCVTYHNESLNTQQKDVVRFTKINTYKVPRKPTDKPFQYRLDYYFDNGKPHRWIELDSNKNVTTEYIYEYDENWKHIGAKYREDGESTYNIEKVRFENESTKVTEWLDSIGKVYYTMTDYLNAKGDTFRAEFKGDKIHGYDSTFYTNEGFPKRIFFTNTKGTVFNDRSFVYDSLNDQKDWVIRRKIMQDTVRELQVREVYYDQNYTNAAHIFYEGILSTSKWSENTFSFTADENTLFLTRTTDWEHQFGVLHTKEKEVFSASNRVSVLDSIYNGALSPSGQKIIYCGTGKNDQTIFLLEKGENGWSNPVNLTKTSNIKGGYFYWLSETELFFYINSQYGNIVQGKLQNQQLRITDELTALNTEEGTEFSPYVAKEKRFIIFTRYLEKGGNRNGFYISLNTGTAENPIWATPQKISTLPYGWNPYFINNRTQFLYTDGDNIRSVPTSTLNIPYEN